MSLLVTLVTLAFGLFFGMGIATVFWWKRINQLHMWWQAHFSAVVQATCAYYLGITDEHGQPIFGVHADEVPPKEGLN